MSEAYMTYIREYWDMEYTANGHQITYPHQSHEQLFSLTKLEIDFFLNPTKEKFDYLLNNKEINPFRTFTLECYKHPSVLKLLGDLSQLTFLDYGVGSTARYSIELSKYFKNGFGIDVSSWAILQAQKELARQQIKNVKMVQNDGVNISLSGNSIDFIFSNLVLQHIGDYLINKKLAQEFIRVLKPGGIMKLEYLASSEKKDDDFINFAEGNGIDDERLNEMFLPQCEILYKTDEEKHALWVTIRKKHETS